MEYLSFDMAMRARFGKKTYRLSLDGGMTCPNRDGTLSREGCIFCSRGGSGDFAAKSNTDLDIQILEAKSRIQNKIGSRDCAFVAYFQSYTNTYGPVDRLEKLFVPVIEREDIAALSIATRPDCLSRDVLGLLSRLNRIKSVWVELGLQTIHEKTAEFINRCYPLGVYDWAVEKLNEIGIEVVTHVILGLPGESREMMLETVDYVAKSNVKGIKLQLLHVLEGTKLAKIYKENPFHIMEMEEYLELLKDCIDLLPEDMVVHRITGDGPKKDLIAPLWTRDKKKVLNAIKNYKGYACVS